MSYFFGHATHDGPGRRLATGCTRGDTLLAAFGFFSHMVFFMSLAFFLAAAFPKAVATMFVLMFVLSAVCLLVRGTQVGSSTTKESIAAIKKAWGSRPDCEVF